MLNNKRQSLIAAIPWIALVSGLIGFAYSTFGTFENENWKHFWGGLSKTVLVSGIFALLLKTFQFLGVFKEELSQIIYDAKFLANRKDLEEVWERVSKVFFKNKFPKISAAITKDIGHLYFPTDHVLYYDDYKQIMEIKWIDEANEIVEVTLHSSFSIFPKSKTEKVDLKTVNVLKFNANKSEVSVVKKKYLVNDVDAIVSITDEVIEKNKLKTTLNTILHGSECYKVETCIVKKYSLIYDNAIGTFKDYLIHDFSLKIHMDAGMKIDFFDAGTSNKFKLVGVVRDNYREYEYKGIIYPKQGYLFFIKKK